MTSTDAREFADGLQERVTQMGDRTGEGQYLGQCLGVIRDLATQLDDANERIAAMTDGRGPEARAADEDVPVRKERRESILD